MEPLLAYLQYFSQILGEISWEVTALFGLIALVALFSRKASSQFRYWLWCIVLLRLCIPIELKMPIGFGDDIRSMVNSLPDLVVEEPEFSRLIHLFESNSSPALLPENASLIKNPKTAEMSESKSSAAYFTMRMCFSLFWLGSVIMISLLVMVRFIRVRRLLRMSRRVERSELMELCNRLKNMLGIRQPIELRFFVSKQFTGPVISGIFKTVVYLPLQIAEAWDVKDVEPILLHELIHIRRIDIIINWLQIFVQIIYFFHPVVWYVNRKIRRLREDACDDEAISCNGIKRSDYAGNMLRIVKESIGETEPFFFAIGFTESGSLMTKRIARILSYKYRKYQGLTRLSIGSLVAIAIAGFVLAGGRSEYQKTALLKNSVIQYTNANYINCLALEGDYLWAGTGGGVVRWDLRTKEYKKYTTLDGLLSNRVESIAIDHEGNKWFGMRDGVNKFDDKKWTLYTPSDGIGRGIVKAITVDRKGNMWFGTYEGANKFDGKKWISYREAGGLLGPVWTIAEDRNGDMWFGTPEDGLIRYDGKNWTSYTTANGLVHNWVKTITIDAEGNKWLGTYRGGVSKFDGKIWKNFSPNKDIVSSNVGAIISELNGNLWIGGDGGIDLFNGKTTEHKSFTPNDSAVGNVITSIAPDKNGKVYFGNFKDGIICYDGKSWTHLRTDDKIASNTVNAIVIDRQGSIWLAGRGGVSKYDDEQWTTYSAKKDGLSSLFVSAAAIDKAGNMWFGVFAGIVNKFDGQKWEKYTAIRDAKRSSMSAIASDQQGNMWFGTTNGLWKCEGRNWSSFTTAHGIINDNVNAVASDKNGNIWIGAGTGEPAATCGISKFDGSTWKSYTIEAEGQLKAVRAIAFDAHGDPWFGTWGGGVRRFDGINFHPLQKKDGLASDFVEAITIEGTGDFWFGTSQGVSIFNGKSWKTLTAADGLCDNMIRAITFDDHGNAWVGTDAGVSLVRTRSIY